MRTNWATWDERERALADMLLERLEVRTVSVHATMRGLTKEEMRCLGQAILNAPDRMLVEVHNESPTGELRFVVRSDAVAVLWPDKPNVMVLNAAGVLITAWRNAPDDHHRTLRRTRLTHRSLVAGLWAAGLGEEAFALVQTWKREDKGRGRASAWKQGRTEVSFRRGAKPAF